MQFVTVFHRTQRQPETSEKETHFNSTPLKNVVNKSSCTLFLEEENIQCKKTIGYTIKEACH